MCSSLPRGKKKTKVFLFWIRKGHEWRFQPRLAMNELCHLGRRFNPHFSKGYATSKILPSVKTQTALHKREIRSSKYTSKEQ